MYNYIYTYLAIFPLQGTRINYLMGSLEITQLGKVTAAIY